MANNENIDFNLIDIINIDSNAISNTDVNVEVNVDVNADVNKKKIKILSHN